MANYELWYTDDLGNRLAYIGDAISFEYVKVEGDIGLATINLPMRRQIYDNHLPDRRIHIFRQPTGGVLSLDFIALAQKFGIGTRSSGLTQMSIGGNDLNDWLRRRIVAYYASETASETNMTDYSDNMAKEIVRDNLIDNADYSGTPDPSRSISANGFSVDANLNGGPAITKSFAWKNLLAVLQEIQATSKSAGTEVFFGIVPTSETTSAFRTWTDQRGQDRTVSTGSNPLIFSLEWGNLSNPFLTYDYSEGENYIYAGGQGQNDARNIQTASDETRMNVSHFGRREGFASAVGVDWTDDDGVISFANDRLAKKRPMGKLTCELLDTPVTPYGGVTGWNLGTRVTVSYAGIQADALVRAVQVKRSAIGRDSVRARVEIDL